MRDTATSTFSFDPKKALIIQKIDIATLKEYASSPEAYLLALKEGSTASHTFALDFADIPYSQENQELVHNFVITMCFLPHALTKEVTQYHFHGEILPSHEVLTALSALETLEYISLPYYDASYDIGEEVLEITEESIAQETAYADTLPVPASSLPKHHSDTITYAINEDVLKEWEEQPYRYFLKIQRKNTHNIKVILDFRTLENTNKNQQLISNFIANADRIGANLTDNITECLFSTTDILSKEARNALKLWPHMHTNAPIEQQTFQNMNDNTPPTVTPKEVGAIAPAHAYKRSKIIIIQKFDEQLLKDVSDVSYLFVLREMLENIGASKLALDFTAIPTTKENQERLTKFFANIGLLEGSLMQKIVQLHFSDAHALTKEMASLKVFENITSIITLEQPPLAPLSTASDLPNDNLSHTASYGNVGIQPAKISLLNEETKDSEPSSSATEASLPDHTHQNATETTDASAIQQESLSETDMYGNLGIQPTELLPIIPQKIDTMFYMLTLTKADIANPFSLFAKITNPQAEIALDFRELYFDKALEKQFFRFLEVCPAHIAARVRTCDFSDQHRTSNNVFCAAFTTFKKLTDIILKDCYTLDSTSLLSISAHCKELQYLNLQGCSQLTTIDLLALALPFPQLKTLDLTGCHNLDPYVTFKHLSQTAMQLTHLVAKDFVFTKQMRSFFGKNVKITAIEPSLQTEPATAQKDQQIDASVHTKKPTTKALQYQHSVKEELRRFSLLSEEELKIHQLTKILERTLPPITLPRKSEMHHYTSPTTSSRSPL